MNHAVRVEPAVGQPVPPDLDGWRALPAAQQPVWHDPARLEQVVAELSVQPPLVFAGEADVLKGRLAEAADGRAFLLQGGDNFREFTNGTDTFIQFNTDADLAADGMIQLSGVLSGDSVSMFL